MSDVFLVFFFQAEDGIRDGHVTGVQTCALPISVAYRIHYDVQRGRWYLTASWQRPVVPTIPLATARARGMIGVDTNADHFAAWRLDSHGNPIGAPRRFGYDLSGDAEHRDAQIRHAITRLLHWAKQVGVAAIGFDDLDFTAEKTREK